MAVSVSIGHALLGSSTRSLLALTPAAWTALKDNMVRENMPPSNNFREGVICCPSRNLFHGLDVCTSHVLVRTLHDSPSLADDKDDSTTLSSVK